MAPTSEQREEELPGLSQGGTEIRKRVGVFCEFSAFLHPVYNKLILNDQLYLESHGVVL